MIRVVIFPVLIVLIRSWQLLDTRLVALWLLHHFDVLIHVDAIILAPVGELVKVVTLLVDGPTTRD